MDSYLQQLIAKRSQMSSPSALMGMAQDQAPNVPPPDIGNTSAAPNINSMMPPTDVQGPPPQQAQQAPPQSVSGATEMASGWKGLLANFMQGMGDAALKSAGLPTSYEKQVYAQRLADKAADDDFAHHLSIAELQEKIRSNQAQEAQVSAVQQQNEFLRLLTLSQQDKLSADNLAVRKENNEQSRALQAQGLQQNATFQKGMLGLREQMLAQSKQAHEDSQANKFATPMFEPNAEGQPQLTVIRPGEVAGIGAMTPTQLGAIVAQTQTEKNKATQAATMLPLIGQQMKEADRLGAAGKLGPFVGRLNDFMAGNIGSGDPDYAKFSAVSSLLTSAVTNIHAGLRGAASPPLIEKFERMFNAKKMDAATYKAGLSAAQDLLTRYAKGAVVPGYSNLSSAPNTATPDTQPPPATAEELRKKMNF